MICHYPTKLTTIFFFVRYPSRLVPDEGTGQLNLTGYNHSSQQWIFLPTVLEAGEVLVGLLAEPVPRPEGCPKCKVLNIA